MENQFNKQNDGMDDDVFVGPDISYGNENSIDWQEPNYTQPPINLQNNSGNYNRNYQNGYFHGYEQQNGQNYRNSQPPYYPPRKAKISTGTKVFVVILSFLFVGTIMVFIGYAAFSISKNIVHIEKNETIVSPFTDMPSRPNLLPSPTPFADEKDAEAQAPNIKYIPSISGLNIASKPSGAELSAQEVYEKVLKSTVTITAEQTVDGKSVRGTGSGVMITEDGIVLTNSHVISNTKSIGLTITASDGKEYSAVVIGFDKSTDLAILKIDATGFTPAEIGDSNELSIGEWVLAVGDPGGNNFKGSLTRGVVSGLDRVIGSSRENGMKYIQTDAAINPGNSGGPLVNMYGQVVGINSAKIVADYYEGMGFSIPLTEAKTVIDELLTKGYVEGRVRLGITGQDIPNELILYGYPQGILIVSLDANGSFAGTEAQVGDIITEIDGEPISGLSMLFSKLLDYKPGDTAKVKLIRLSEDESKSSELTVTITFDADKAE